MTKPDHIGKYEILAELGRGGFAVVYQARDPTLDRTVALKVLAPHLSWEPDFVRQFHREAKTVARLRHPHIVIVHEIGEEEGQLYISMEYIQGHTLARKLIEQGALPLDQVVTILDQLADALDYAHGNSILHRDVKPGNIMVTESGWVELHTTLMDFGLTKAMEGSQYVRTSGQIVGTPEHMSPEQAEGEELDHRSDLYSLGVVAYQMCTGQAPFTAPSPLAVLRGHTDKPPPSPRDLNPQLLPEVEQVLLKALAKKPDERYQSAGDLARALRHAVEAEARARQREKQLAGLYAQLQQAVADQDWHAAETRCCEILALESDYQDVPELWTQVREARARQRQLEKLYAQAQAQARSESWADVQALCQQIETLEPGYHDTRQLLRQAEEKVYVEQTRKERQQEERLVELYGELEEAIKGHSWTSAETQCQEILALEPEYQDVQNLWRQVQEAQARQRELERLYREARVKVKSGSWAEAKHLCRRIETLQPGYRDASELLSKVEANLRLEQVQKKRQARPVWIYGFAVALVIVALFLPPFSILERLGITGHTTLDEANSSISHPDGLTLSVNPETFTDKLRVQLDSVPRLEFLEASAGSALREAAEALPAHLVLKSPYYKIQVRGDLSQPVKIDVIVPTDAEPWETLALYTWTGEAWEWVEGELHTEVTGYEFIRAYVTDIPVSLVVVQADSISPIVSIFLEPGDNPVTAAANAINEVNPSGLLLGTDGGFIGDLNSLLQPTEGDTYTVLPTLRNWAQGATVNRGLLSDLFIPEIQKIHIANIVRLCTERGFAGIDVDYQGVGLDDRDAYSDFISALADALHAEELLLSVVVEYPTSSSGSWDTGGYDWVKLGAVADAVKIPFPADPTVYVEGGNTQHLLDWAVTQVDRYKLRMLVSSLSAERSDEEINYISLEQALTPFGEVVALNDVTQVEPGSQVEFGFSGRLPSITPQEDAGTYRLEYEVGDEGTRTIWLGTAANLAAKLRWAQRYNLGGIAVADMLDPGNGSGIVDTVASYRAGTAYPESQPVLVVWTVASETTTVDQQTSHLAEPGYTWTVLATNGKYTVKATIGGFDHGSVPIVVGTLEPESVVTEVPVTADCLDANFVANVTIPDNTQMEKGEEFGKTWELRNSGTCDWPEDTALVGVESELGGPESVEVGPVEVGASIEISVRLVAPDTDGVFDGLWVLKTGDIEIPGGRVTAVIRVGEGAGTSEPPPATATPEPTQAPPPPPPIPTFGPSPTPLPPPPTPTYGPSPTPRSTSTPHPDGATVYIVESGDTLFGIALMHNVTIEQIRALNASSLGPNEIIVPGQALVISIPSDMPTPTPLALSSATSVAEEGASICVLAYHDRNGNTFRDDEETEELLPNAEFTVSSASGVVALYTSDGVHEPHCFTVLAGVYQVSLKSPPGYTASGQAEWPVAVAEETSLAIQFGNTRDESLAALGETAEPTPAGDEINEPVDGSTTGRILAAIAKISGILMLFLAAGVAVIFIFSRRRM